MAHRSNPTAAPSLRDRSGGKARQRECSAETRCPSSPSTTASGTTWTRTTATPKSRKHPYQEDETQQKGWRPHADPILQVKDLSKFVISYELEAVFDAQAFDKGTPRAKRALRAVLKGNLARLDSTLAWDHDRAEDAFAKDIKPSVNTTECCYILVPDEDVGLICLGPNESRRRGRARQRRCSYGRRWAGLYGSRTCFPGSRTRTSC